VTSRAGAASRRLEFDGMVNFRDLGGLPANGGFVRPGRVFRSDSIAYASEADAARLVDELGLVTWVDLRGEYEVALLGRGRLEATDVVYVSAPIVDVSEFDHLPDHYVAMFAEKGDVLVSVIRRFARPGALPAVVHCEAGCDRTGVLSAALLSLLGVPDEEIAADYGQTMVAVPAINARSRMIAARHGLPLPVGYGNSTWMPTADMMAETLTEMRGRWGDAVGWALEYGLTEAEIDILRSTLVSRSFVEPG